MIKYEFATSKTLLAQMVCYPLTVLATNRILDTVISRKSSGRLFSDLLNTWKIGGLGALYAGFLPYFLFSQFLNYTRTINCEEVEEGASPKSEMGPLLNFFYQQFGHLFLFKIGNESGFLNLRLFKPFSISIDDEEIENEPRKMTIVKQIDTWTYISLVGLSNIQIIRMQCIDYPFRNKLIRCFHDTVQHDFPMSLWLGLVPILAG
jgi:hypothetical protein